LQQACLPGANPGCIAKQMGSFLVAAARQTQGCKADVAELYRYKL
jgi:hypothetical protein